MGSQRGCCLSIPRLCVVQDALAETGVGGGARAMADVLVCAWMHCERGVHR